MKNPFEHDRGEGRSLSTPAAEGVN